MRWWLSLLLVWFTAPTMVAQQTDLTGTVEHLIEDHFDTGTSVDRFLVTGQGRTIELPAPRGRALGLTTGDRVRVRGRVRPAKGTEPETVEAEATVDLLQSAEAPLLSELVTTWCVRVNWANDLRTPPTCTGANALNTYFPEVSYGRLSSDVRIFPVMTLLARGSTCDYHGWMTQAAIALGGIPAGVNFGIAFPSGVGCSWQGLGNVGGRRFWVNGSNSALTYVHETGHSVFSLAHAASVTCSTTWACSMSEYGDSLDTLGNSRIGHINARSKRWPFVGWLTDAHLVTATTSGTYTIGPYEVIDAQPRALVIPSAVTQPPNGPNLGAGEGVVVELRTSQTAFPTPTGLTLHHYAPASSGRSHQLDANRSAAGMQAILPAGGTWTDVSGLVQVTPLSVSSTGAVIQVALGADVPAEDPTPNCTASDTIRTSATALWTIDAAFRTLLNGVHAGGGLSSPDRTYWWADGTLYVLGRTGGYWWRWAATEWQRQTTIRPSCGAPPLPDTLTGSGFICTRNPDGFYTCQAQ